MGLIDFLALFLAGVPLLLLTYFVVAFFWISLVQDFSAAIFAALRNAPAGFFYGVVISLLSGIFFHFDVFSDSLSETLSLVAAQMSAEGANTFQLGVFHFLQVMELSAGYTLSFVEKGFCFQAYSFVVDQVLNFIFGIWRISVPIYVAQFLVVVFSIAMILSTVTAIFTGKRFPGMPGPIFWLVQKVIDLFKKLKPVIFNPAKLLVFTLAVFVLSLFPILLLATVLVLAITPELLTSAVSVLQHFSGWAILIAEFLLLISTTLYLAFFSAWISGIHAAMEKKREERRQKRKAAEQEQKIDQQEERIKKLESR